MNTAYIAAHFNDFAQFVAAAIDDEKAPEIIRSLLQKSPIQIGHFATRNIAI